MAVYDWAKPMLLKTDVVLQSGSNRAGRYVDICTGIDKKHWRLWDSDQTTCLGDCSCRMSHVGIMRAAHKKAAGLEKAKAKADREKAWLKMARAIARHLEKTLRGGDTL